MTERQTIAPAIAEVAPERSTGLLELSRNKVIRSVGAVVCAAAFFGGNLASAQTSGQSTPNSGERIAQSEALEISGVTTNELWVEDPVDAEAAALQIVTLGANAAHIIVPYSKGQYSIGGGDDKERFCNAAQALEKQDLKLVVTFLGWKKGKNGKLRPGYVPEGYSEITRFISTVDSYLWTLAGPNGCAKGLKQIDLIPFNEVNDDFFYDLNGNHTLKTHGKKTAKPTKNKKAQKPQRNTEKQAGKPSSAAVHYTELLGRLIPAVQSEAAKPELNMKVNFWIGAIASGHEPLKLIKDIGTTIEVEHLEDEVTDRIAGIAEHPYGTDNGNPNILHPNGNNIGMADYPDVTEAIKAAFGRTLPIIYDEYGSQSTIPKAKLKYYIADKKTDYNTIAASEETQGIYYSDGYRIARCQKLVKGMMIFLLSDEPKLSRYQSGLFYNRDLPQKLKAKGVKPQYIPKSSYSTVQTAIKQSVDPSPYAVNCSS